MEAIDDYANENIARSLAHMALEYRQQHSFVGLLPIASHSLRQRVHFLGPKSETDANEWNSVVQWQQDECPDIIETMWTDGCSGRDDLYQNPVYYKRLDAETLHAVVEFACRDTKHYVVVLILEEGNGDISELKYHNTKVISQEEWDRDILTDWSLSLEEAERQFLTKVTREKRKKVPETPEINKTVNAPEDYWGDWSSDEDEERSGRGSGTASRSHGVREDGAKSEADSEDEYYARWSQNPGTLTPGLDEEVPPAQPRSKMPTRILQSHTVLGLDTEQQEMEEEYDQSHNPLFTVPSVPNLMDAHTNALAELTHMLQTSLPGQRGRINGLQPMSAINPLPKAALLQEQELEHSRQSQPLSADGFKMPKSPRDIPEAPQSYHVPGAYPVDEPEEETNTTAEPASSVKVDDVASAVNVSLWDQQKREAGRVLMMKSLTALIAAGKLLGFQGSEIVDMVRDIVNAS
ncbi:uncharacterized protein BYT42DRAFT_541150 [Radiomyces spectabilis]|uniref:uncharacterized protein n=1 Tax=Radiomyces spectabilis TaxID=64574 RepID=UPI00221F239C|nr:uncharacterized protein BYT42DRAFT_541150 [Radiomyces spectabilis]KAI8365394.1 hypothetical protein BYT42DRAFT_541150 [Radiomyces spectabilis]